MSGSIYVFHALFFAAFALRLVWKPPSGGAPRASGGARRAPGSRALVALHALGFSVVYYDIGNAVFRHQNGPLLFAPRPVAGASLIVLAAALVAWALLVFRSWRLEARIEEGHELCTRGPYGLARHPIYLATDLLLIGTVVWHPSPTALVGSLVSFLGADLRARAEERLLVRTFGGAYEAYAARVHRFVPGLY